MNDWMGRELTASRPSVLVNRAAAVVPIGVAFPEDFGGARGVQVFVPVRVGREAVAGVVGSRLMAAAIDGGRAVLFLGLWPGRGRAVIIPPAEFIALTRQVDVANIRMVAPSRAGRLRLRHAAPKTREPKTKEGSQ